MPESEAVSWANEIRVVEKSSKNKEMIDRVALFICQNLIEPWYRRGLVILLDVVRRQKER